jgi:hypothetical protein
MLRFYATIFALSIPIAEGNRKIFHPAQRGEVADISAVVDNSPIAIDSESTAHEAISVSRKHSRQFVSHSFLLLSYIDIIQALSLDFKRKI